MTARPRDWSPLDLGSDPTPGDPDQVDRAGRHYRDVADAIRTAASRLREIAQSPDMKSQAVEAFVGTAEEVASEIERAHTRYDGVGEALVAYSPLLQAAQDDADDALRRAVTAREEMQSAQLRLDHAESDLSRAQRDAMLAPPDAPPADFGAEQSAVTRARQDHDAAQRDLDRAKADAENAREAWERAANAAKARIEDVKDSGDLNDSTWDKVANALKKIADIAGMVAAVCGILALAVGWIPVIGQALAAVLGTIALVAGIVSLVCNVALLVGGKGSWKSVILDAVGVATFGIGRAVIGGARAAYRGSQAMARLSAGRWAAQSPAARIAAGLPGGSSRSAMRSMLGGSGLANLTRSQARNMLSSARRVPAFSALAPLRTAWDDIRALPTNFRTVADVDNIRAAWQGVRGEAGSIFSSPSFAQGFARFSGETDALAHLDFTSGLNAALREGGTITRSGVYAGIQLGTVGVSSGLDTYQFVDSDMWGEWFDSPADQLRLPGDGVIGR